MKLERWARRTVKRYGHRSNPHSMRMAVMLLEAARRIEGGDRYWRDQIDHLASHFKECSPDGDDVDEVRAGMWARRFGTRRGSESLGVDVGGYRGGS